jgi:hypothetical protein
MFAIIVVQKLFLTIHVFPSVLQTLNTNRSIRSAHHNAKTTQLVAHCISVLQNAVLSIF